MIAQFPLLYFFAFLYYTDVGSTLFVLVTYYASLRSSHATAALAGIIAILFRQTNIVWLGFCCLVAVLGNLRKLGLVKNDDALHTQVWCAVTGCFKSFTSTLFIVFPYVGVLVGFVCFVVWNDGIVVGDRSSHQASLNLPQILYFVLFSMVFASFLVINYLLDLLSTVKSIWKRFSESVVVNLVCLIVLSVAMVAAVHYFTYQHLYLISDNRHFTFYIWRKVFSCHPLAKYALVPVYLVSVLIMIRELSWKRSTLWIAVFFACTAIVLVPQKLLEFRYFIVPYLLFRLNLRASTWLQLIVEGLVYTAVNASTIWIFLRRTHTQNGLPGQRIMW